MNELIERFGQVAWEAAMRQVQLDLFFNIVFGVVLVLVAWIFRRMFTKDAAEAGELAILRGIIWLVLLISLIPFSIALKQTINPEFYAIEKFIPGKK